MRSSSWYQARTEKQDSRFWEKKYQELRKNFETLWNVCIYDPHQTFLLKMKKACLQVRNKIKFLWNPKWQQYVREYGDLGEIFKLIAWKPDKNEIRQ